MTRPDPDGERSAALLRARGHQVMVAPLLRVMMLDNPELGAGPWSAVAFTSTNAVRAAERHRRFAELVRLPAYTVGARTRSAALGVGFSAVRSAEGDARDLVRLIVEHRQPGALPLLYLAGEARSGDLGLALSSQRVRAETVIVYCAEPAMEFAESVQLALAQERIDAVLHYSARSAASFVSAATAAGMEDLLRQTRHLCLSAQVAAPLVAAGAQRVEVARQANEAALFERVGPA